MAGQGMLFDLGTPSLPEFDPTRCITRPINYETATNMVKEYHYAHRVPHVVISIGMYVDDVLAGCATCGVPPNNQAISSICGNGYMGLEFNRLFVHDWVGRNAESWFVGQLFGWIRRDWKQYEILVSYSDPNVGHHGGIYQATNWLYLGQGCPESGSPDSDMILNGKVASRKNVYNRYGTTSIPKLQQMGLDAETIRTIPKHRYVHFIGSRRRIKELMAALRWKPLPYPKPGEPIREAVHSDDTTKGEQP